MNLITITSPMASQVVEIISMPTTSLLTVLPEFVATMKRDNEQRDLVIAIESKKLARAYHQFMQLCSASCRL